MLVHILQNEGQNRSQKFNENLILVFEVLKKVDCSRFFSASPRSLLFFSKVHNYT